jgi:hypothetical protein
MLASQLDGIYLYITTVLSLIIYPLFVILCIILNGDRPVVNQRNVHHGAKNTIFDCPTLWKSSLDLCQHLVVELLSLWALGGIVKVWLLALLDLGKQSELTNTEHFSTNVEHTLFPLLCSIDRGPKFGLDDFVGDLLHVFCRIFMAHSDKNN